MAFPRAIDKNKDYSVRRVVKQGPLSICGMCGTRYSNEAQAEACLKNCTARYMAQNAVHDKTEKAGKVYRCAYCKRIYEKMINAKECAKTCKSEIQKKIDAESRFKSSQPLEEKLKNLAAYASSEQNLPAIKATAKAQAQVDLKSPPKKTAAAAQEDPVPSASLRARAPEPPPADPLARSADKPVHPAQGSKFDKDGHSYKCHSCHQKYKKYQEAISCYDRHREQEKAGVHIKKEGDEKFFRDGGKYVCKKCSSKWFSRKEVIDCFDGHKEEEDVWIKGGPQGKAKPSPAPGAKESLESSRAKRADARSDGEKFFRDGAKYVCRVCNKKQFTKSEVIQCYDSHSAEAATPLREPDTGPILTAQDIAAAGLDQAPANAKSGRNRDGEDKFYRDGAKYVCKKCNPKHFTRGDVIQCFDKH